MVNGSLGSVRAFCNCTTPHVVLRGRSAFHGRCWTKVAQAYPKAQSDCVAKSVAVGVGWSTATTRRPQVPLSAAVAGQESARIGEAANPGPRKLKVARDDPLGLEGRPLQQLATLALGDRCWDCFLSWVVSFLSSDPFDLFSRSPPLLAMALRAYGCWLYKSGSHIHLMRHNILAAQRKILTLKPWTSIVWELVSRWEQIEPPRHRTLVPEPVLMAMVALGWMAGYREFAGCTLLSFYGMGRIGEVLATCKADLLPPSDDPWSQVAAVFLRLRTSKTMARGRPRVQHLKVIDLRAVELLQALYKGYSRSQRLFALTPSAYRYRWNKLLRVLCIGAESALTPGGLRGGGAVQSYRAGIGVQEIQ